MSYVALSTDRFDEVARFYAEHLGFPVLERWERRNARGVRLDAQGMRLEILDNARERTPLQLGSVDGRAHIVVEVDDIDATRAGIGLEVAPVTETSWGARLFRVQDPDGVPLTFLQWSGEGEGAA